MAARWWWWISAPPPPSTWSTSTGAYLGGVISPGINLSIEALHQAAARLPRIGIGRPQAVIGRSTIPAMRSGIYWGYVGLIEGLLVRIEGRISARP